MKNKVTFGTYKVTLTRIIDNYEKIKYKCEIQSHINKN